MKPGKLTLRVYNVGFGDCFLLTFQYPGSERHVLIDFGSTGASPHSEANLLLRIAKDISRHCGGKLDAVVATHRHRDHINGFATRKNGAGPGDIIAACHPTLIVQPWTEHPDAALAGFIGENDLPNLSAVENLQRMGVRNRYVHYGSDSGLANVLPGITVHVLGPPTLQQSTAIRKKRSADRGEFWLTQALLAFNRNSRLFPRAMTCRPSDRMPHTRWFLRRLNALRASQRLEIVRELDSVLNNTSVILLIEVGDRKLLFPGDAQIESWSYALSHPGVRKMLAGVDLYKVGHHGSRNATPKSLWNLFARRSAKPSAGRLRTVLSTMANKFGEISRETEVPRVSLVQMLKAESDYFSTQDIPGKLYEDIIIDL